MSDFVEKFAENLKTYMDQSGHVEFKDETVVDDIVFFIGNSLDCDRYNYGCGFDRFRVSLIERWSKELEGRRRGKELRCRDK